VTGDCGIVCTTELHNWCCSVGNNRVKKIKKDGMSQACGMGGRNECCMEGFDQTTQRKSTSWDTCLEMEE
jgi:hypothetical protein